MTVSVGPLRPDEAPRCAELERELFGGEDPWSTPDFLIELATGCRYLAARTVDGVLVGYGGMAVRGPRAEIHTLGVDPACQRRGIGRALLRGLLASADALRASVSLDVRTDNEAAIRLYESEGFTIVGTRRCYYQPGGADAYTMRRGRQS